MRIRLWELALGVLGLLLALVYLLAGSIALGIGLAAAVAAGLAARMAPLELPGVAGGHARRQASLEAVKTAGLLVVALVALSLLLVGGLARWSADPIGVVAIFALTGLEVMLLIELSRRTDSLLAWLNGADSEEAVRAELERLPESWFVTHNLLRDRGGNIDHVAIGSTGAFAIETKSRRYRGADAAQALGAAMALRERLGVSWVTAVVCVPGDVLPEKKGPIWLVGRDALLEWILNAREHRGRAVDVAAAGETLRTMYALS